MEEDMHIGKIIEKELKNISHSKTWLAQQLNCERSNVYKIFKKEYIDMELLDRISIIMGHNFYEDCAKNMKKKLRKK